MKMRSWQHFSDGFFNIEDVCGERGEGLDPGSVVRQLNRELKKAMQDGGEE